MLNKFTKPGLLTCLITLALSPLSAAAVEAVDPAAINTEGLIAVVKGKIHSYIITHHEHDALKSPNFTFFTPRQRAEFCSDLDDVLPGVTDALFEPSSYDFHRGIYKILGTLDIASLDKLRADLMPKRDGLCKHLSNELLELIKACGALYSEQSAFLATRGEASEKKCELTLALKDAVKTCDIAGGRVREAEKGMEGWYRGQLTLHKATVDSISAKISEQEKLWVDANGAYFDLDGKVRNLLAASNRKSSVLALLSR